MFRLGVYILRGVFYWLLHSPLSHILFSDSVSGKKTRGPQICLEKGEDGLEMQRWGAPQQSTKRFLGTFTDTQTPSQTWKVRNSGVYTQGSVLFQSFPK